jgi:hypothetical protein
MGWRILVFYPTNIRQPMLKLKTHSGFHDLFLNQSINQYSSDISNIKGKLQSVEQLL